MARVDAEALLQLNQEILALVRARLPVASELPVAAAQLSGTASTLASQLEQRMQSGASLDEAVAAEAGSLPAFYATLIRAGIRANRLPAALEAFHNAYQRLIELRRLLTLALAYPLLVSVLALTMLIASAVWLFPTYDWIEIQSPLGLSLFRNPPVWLWGMAIVVPALLVVMLFYSRMQSSASSAVLSRSVRFLAWFPGVRQIVRLTAFATFTDLLSLLVRQATPLEEALPLAAAASGWPSLEGPAKAMANHLAAGNAMESAPALPQLPPLVQVSLLAAKTPANLAAQLADAADRYDLRARDTVQRMSSYFPALATAIIGGGVVSLYAVLMLRPYIVALIEVSAWH